MQFLAALHRQRLIWERGVKDHSNHKTQLPVITIQPLNKKSLPTVTVVLLSLLLGPSAHSYKTTHAEHQVIILIAGGDKEKVHQGKINIVL